VPGSTTELRQYCQNHTALLTMPTLARKTLPCYFVILIEWMSESIGQAA
jgi:hypothetical protein